LQIALLANYALFLIPNLFIGHTFLLWLKWYLSPLAFTLRRQHYAARYNVLSIAVNYFCGGCIHLFCARSGSFDGYVTIGVTPSVSHPHKSRNEE
jgi:hypothetical protein